VPDLEFDWVHRKDAQNRRKHGVSFEEAKTVFLDENGLLVADPDHSRHEDRFIVLGLSSSLRALVVCHCYRHDRGVIRIISARRANTAERRKYEVRWKQ
jgi:uncharacterized DUF497 family protein